MMNYDIIEERERHKQARAALSQVTQNHNGEVTATLFSVPVRCAPTEDHQKIVDTLGDYEFVKKFVLHDQQRFLGITPSVTPKRPSQKPNATTMPTLNTIGPPSVQLTPPMSQSPTRVVSFNHHPSPPVSQPLIAKSIHFLNSKFVWSPSIRRDVENSSFSIADLRISLPATSTTSSSFPPPLVTQHTVIKKNKNSSNLINSQQSQQVICKIDLNRLSRIPSVPSTAKINYQRGFNQFDHSKVNDCLLKSPKLSTISDTTAATATLCNNSSLNVNNSNNSVFIPGIERKRSSSFSNISNKKFKKNVQVDAEEHFQKLNYDLLQPILPQPTVKYKTVYKNDELDDSSINDMWDQHRFLTEAERLKHAADKESDHFAQQMLYFECVLYLILTGVAMEKEVVTKKAAPTIYKEALTLIKITSSKFLKQQQSFTMQQGNIHSKVVILSLRCQSILYLELYKMRKLHMKEIQKNTNEYWQKTSEIPTGNTASPISPTNSIGSQEIIGSSYSSEWPNWNMVYYARKNQHILFNYLSSSHDVWDEADSLVENGSHTDFFIALDHENGPISLNTSLYNVVKYVQLGIQKLKLMKIKLK